MKTKIKLFAVAIVGAAVLMSCNRPEPNYEGVLMTDYGRNGIESFKTVTGAQGILGPGSELYQVPMYEEKGDCEAVYVTARDAGKFTVDPSYTYQATRGKGPNIVLNYKHLGTGQDFFDNIEARILDKIVVDAFREKSRFYTTDSLMNNLGQFETEVELDLKNKFKDKFFTLNTLTSGLNPPKSMADAIESRNNAIQEANQVRNQLETAKMLQDKAKIDAETNRIKAQGLDSKILQQQWIEAIRNGRNKVIITDGRTPIMLSN